MFKHGTDKQAVAQQRPLVVISEYTSHTSHLLQTKYSSQQQQQQKWKWPAVQQNAIVTGTHQSLKSNERLAK